jgi:aminopeptidase N
MATISLSYQADVRGQTRQGYNIFSTSENTIALAGFYPALAVYDQTGWNIEEPPIYGDATYLDTSFYQVKLTSPEPLVVVASGSLVNKTSNGDGSQTLALVSGPMRDFYIAARTDFKVISQTVEGTVVNSYYPPELAAGGKSALGYAADSLRVYNERFGRYPYAEFDVVATPTNAGGVEYPGVVVVSQWMYDDSGGFFEHATAHEVAHQWWYGLVGNDQVDTPWLDESLTNYSAVLYWEEIEGADSAKTIIKRLFLGPYEQVKNQGQDRAVIGRVADFSESEYGAIVYGKGPLFFEALRQEVGDETYFKIMQTYLAKYKYKIAQPDDLFNIIQQISGRDIKPLIETWLEK